MEGLLGGTWHSIATREGLQLELLETIAPRYVFFPHWSYIIPRAVYETFECVVFHMTDLPYGRGGSPLQNLVVRGHQETVVSALRVSAGLDTGPVYGKRPLSLLGTAEEILLRATHVTEELMAWLVRSEVVPQAQIGPVTTFTRRTPDEGNVTTASTLEALHDHIRMLDADGYPPAFLETEHLHFAFSRASLKHDRVIADVTITRKPSRQ